MVTVTERQNYFIFALDNPKYIHELHRIEVDKSYLNADEIYCYVWNGGEDHRDLRNSMYVRFSDLKELIRIIESKRGNIIERAIYSAKNMYKRFLRKKI